MNNLKQKNIIYGKDAKDVLPHGGKGDSVALSQNSNITDARINNATLQLINNDLYLENKMRLGINYQAGPERDGLGVQALPDGSKVWMDSGDYTQPLRICRKVEMPLSASIYSARSGSVRFILPLNSTVFVSFEDGLMYETRNGFEYCTDLSGNSVFAVGYCDSLDGTFFASVSAIYRLTQPIVADSDETKYQLQRIETNVGLDGISCIAYDSLYGMLYVGGAGFMARCAYRPGLSSVTLTSDIKFSQNETYETAVTLDGDEEYFEDISVNGLNILDRDDSSVNENSRKTDIVAATDRGLFRSDTRKFLAVDSLLAGRTCIDVAACGNDVYALDTDGYVYRRARSGGNFVKYPDDPFAEPMALAEYQSDLYVVCKRAIYKYTSYQDTPTVNMELSVGYDIGAFAVAGLYDRRIIFTADDDKVMYYSDFAQSGICQISGVSAISQITAQPRKNKAGVLDVYTLAKIDDENVISAICMEYDRTPIRNLSVIDSMEMVAPSCDAVVCDADRCYYAKDGAIYNADTGGFCRIGDVKVNQMAYLSSVDCVIAVTDDTVYAVDASALSVKSQYYAPGSSPIKRVSPTQDIVYFASETDLSAIRLSESGFDSQAVEAVNLPNGISGLAAEDGNAYIFGDSGSLSSITPYYARIAAESISGSDALDIRFPVMRHMEETNVSAALGISAGYAYELVYKDGVFESCNRINVPAPINNGNLSAFCKAGTRFFMLQTNGKLRQYDYGESEFDLNDISSGTQVATVSNISAERLIYSGTDSFFDMRIYAQTSDGPKVYQPQLSAIQKLQCNKVFGSFMMYIDAVGEDGDDAKYYAVVAGITDNNMLSVNPARIQANDQPWNGNWYNYGFADITAGPNQHGSRKPYAIFYVGNNNAYVAYTALSSSGDYIDCVAAIPVNNLLSGGTQPSLIVSNNFDIVDEITGFNDGHLRFSGFSLNSASEEDEDIDVVAVCTQNELLTYQISSTSDMLQGYKGKTTISGASSYDLFQPDCIKIKNDYYILIAGKDKSSTNHRVQTWLYKYEAGNNSCTDLTKHSVISSEASLEVSDVFVAYSPKDTPDDLQLIMVFESGMAYSVEITNGKTIQLKDEQQVKAGQPFNKVSRFSLNQLIGYTDEFIYDFQTGATYRCDEQPAPKSVYATDNGDSRDYMLMQDFAGKIYSVEPDWTMRFNPVKLGSSDLTGPNMTICKAGSKVFIVDRGSQDIDSPSRQIRIFDEAESGFTVFATALLKGDSVIDASICYYDDTYYLCLRRSNSKSIEVYRIKSGLQLIAVFDDAFSTNNSGYIPYIAYESVGSSFVNYIRNGLFGGSLKGYSWIFTAEDGNTGKYRYLDFSLGSDLRFTEPKLKDAGNYINIGTANGIAYGTYSMTSHSVYKRIIKRLSVSEFCIGYTGDASKGWLAGDKYFFAKPGGGLAYSCGTEWHEIADGTYSDIVGKTDGRCYFLKNGDSSTDLFLGISNMKYPLKTPEQCGPSPLAPSSTRPVRLVRGRAYAGYVGIEPGSSVYKLYALAPMLAGGSMPLGSGSSGGSTPGYEYSVTVLESGIQMRDDGYITQMTVLGDFLDEIIVRGSKYLHVAQVQDRLFVDESLNSSVVPVVETLPYTELASEMAVKGVRSSAKNGNTRYIILSGEPGVYAFSDPSSGVVMKSLSRQMLADSVDARAFYEIGQNKFLVATNSGVYRYMHINGIPQVNRISQQYDVAQITSYNFSGAPQDTYAMANGLDNMFYTSQNGRVWRAGFRPAPGALRSIYPQNAHEWYFGTSSGLFKSKYEYKLVDDVKKFTENDLYALYNDLMSSDISDICQDSLDSHEISEDYKYGHSVSSLVSEINQTMLSVNFDGLQSSGWQRSESVGNTYQVSNDIVFEQYWGDDSDWNMSLSVENHLTSQANANFTYLFRRWMSGMTEIYVHIPTTNTYYINHVPSSPNYNINETITELTAANVSHFGRDKQVFSHDPNNSYTKIRLTLSRSVFNINMLLNVQACGNSLPLKIYRETIEENGTPADYEASQYFNSYIAPTVMTALRTSDEDYTFEFACFGTDEQAIRISFMDNVNKFDQAYYRIVFNPNGLGTDQSQFVKQRIRADGLPYKLRRNQYRWPQDQKLFAGWTFTPYPKDDQTSGLRLFEDAQEITSGDIEEYVKDIRSGQDVMLYAVWITYQFSPSDTTLLLAPSPESARFRIGSVEVTDEYNIGDRVVVKFEEADS